MQEKSTNITWHAGTVEKADREKLLQQKGAILWFTGLSGSGKSTIAVAVEQALYEAGHPSYRLDGDNIRHGLNTDLTFSPEDRSENIRRIGEVGKLFADAGLLVLASFISPYQQDRDRVRALVPEKTFIEIYIKASPETCEARDPKGLYKKARAGEISDFTGLHAPYEEPKNPEIVIDTDQSTVEESTQTIIDWLHTHEYLF